MEFSHTDKENPEDFLPNDAAEADETSPLFTPEAEDFEASSPTQSHDEPISSINDEGTETTSTTITPETTKPRRPKRWGSTLRRAMRHIFLSPWYLLRWIVRLLLAIGRLFLRIIGFKRIDRYILVRFLSTYVFLLALIITIAIIFDFNEKIDKLTNGGARWHEVVFDYYANFIPYFSNMFSPLFVFIAVIFFTTQLANRSEIIAMKSAGMSFRRLLRPFFMGAAIIAATSFALGAYVIPQGNVARVNFENKYIKKQLTVDEADNIQMQVDSGVVAYIAHFDNRTKSGSGFSLDKFSEKKLVSRLTAETMQYDTLADHKYSWTLHGYMQRTLRGSREKIKSGEKLDTTIIMEPKDFFYIKGMQETMTVPELSAFIDRQRLRGAAGISTFEVEYHKRFATPLAAFILTLIGVAISCEKRKGGMGTSIGIGLALTFTYIMLQTVAASFATNAGWPAGLSVWMPNILFAFIALWFYRRTPQ